MRRLPPAGGAMRRAVPCAWLRQWEDRSRQPAAHLVARVKMTARFSMGFKDIFRRGSNYLEYKMLHMRGTVAVSYAFLRYNDKPFRK